MGSADPVRSATQTLRADTCPPCPGPSGSSHSAKHVRWPHEEHARPRMGRAALGYSRSRPRGMGAPICSRRSTLISSALATVTQRHGFCAAISFATGSAMPRKFGGRALPLVERLNGAQRIPKRCSPCIATGSGAWWIPTGKMSITQFAEAHFDGSGALKAVVEASDAQGNLIAPPPRASEVQRWVQAAQANDDVADLLKVSGERR